MPAKYIGQIVEIIYMDQSGKVTQRMIQVNGIRNGFIKATDLRTRSPGHFAQTMYWHGCQLIKQLRGEEMLEDLEHKILRILYNYFTLHNIFPTIKELEIKTGKSAGRIKHVLTELERKGYISWEDKSDIESIVILQAWEQESSRHSILSRDILE